MYAKIISGFIYEIPMIGARTIRVYLFREYSVEFAEAILVFASKSLNVTFRNWSIDRPEMIFS